MSALSDLVLEILIWMDQIRPDQVIPACADIRLPCVFKPSCIKSIALQTVLEKFITVVILYLDLICHKGFSKIISKNDMPASGNFDR